MADPKSRGLVFNPIDEPNTPEGSQGTGVLVDNDLPGGGLATALTPKVAAQKAQQEKEVTGAYAREWEELLGSDEET